MTPAGGDNIGRILIFVVAYHAEKHIESLFQKIPGDLFNNESIHFLVIDDASADYSVHNVNKWLAGNKIENVTVLKNQVNQGYGGNQKLGYRLGIDNDFDLVILLHGDGQYDPALLHKFINTWRETDADVILGSRMQDVKSARAGGMPLYKILGNRLLTRFQNLLTGQDLSEYHTGYRAFSTRFLNSVPFEINTNDFHFDTEILLQAHYLGARIVEFPIPTRYGDETCHVNGISYATNIFFTTTQYALHRIGVLCSLKYRNLSKEIYQDKTEQIYSSHAKALRIVKEYGPSRILDIGCGSGFVAKRCEEYGSEVTGIDRERPRTGMMSAFFRVDIEAEQIPLDVFSYELVLLLDVIEHLANPEQFLLEIRNRSQALLMGKKSPTLVVSTPNVAFIGVRMNLLLGRFNYAERGILDISHKRLFTKNSLTNLLKDCGYVVNEIRGVGVPFQAVLPNRFGKLMSSIADFFAWIWPSMFGFQFMVTCRPKPGVRQILKQSEHFYGKTLDKKDPSQEVKDIL